MENLLSLKKRLEKAQNEEDDSALRDTLQELAHVTISKELLEKTRIGLTVGRIRKHDDTELANEAVELVTKWKKQIATSTPTSSLRTSNPRNKVGSSSEGKEKGKVIKNAKVETVSIKEDYSDSGKVNGNKVTTSTTYEKIETKKTSVIKTIVSPSPPPAARRPLSSSGDGVRDKVRALIQEGLGEKEEPGDSDPADSACEIEEELYKMFGGTTPEYRSKFRTIFNNLKNPDNKQLGRSILEGSLDVATLCRMSTQELASKEQQERKQALEAALIREATRGDMEASTDMFKCGKCKERKTTYYQLQIRSADEPMTTFVTCVNCGNRWKF